MCTSVSTAVVGYSVCTRPNRATTLRVTVVAIDARWCAMGLSWRKQVAALIGLGVFVGGVVDPAVAAVPSPTVAAADTQSVFRTINRERAAHHLAALRWNANLASVARAHNIKMAQADTLSHQLAGEPSIGVQISTAGYTWSALGENLAA